MGIFPLPIKKQLFSEKNLLPHKKPEPKQTEHKTIHNPICIDQIRIHRIYYWAV